METETLVKRQLELGSTIERLHINFNKDGKERKTTEYLNTRLQTLTEYWNEFEKNDDSLREACDDPKSNEYFSKEYYQQVETIYLRLKQDIETKLSTVPIPKDNKSVQDKPKASTSAQPVIKALINTMNTLRTIIGSADDPQLSSATVIEHIIGRIEKYLQIMEEKERSGINIPIPIDIQEEYALLQSQAEQKILSLKIKLIEGVHPVEADPGLHVVQPLMKLSQISIPKFNGDTTEWPQFHDLFTQLVHNQNISKAVKMFYLKDNISGEAERVVRHLTVSEANYDAAWAILNDKREMVNRWLERLVNQRAISNASFEGIKQLHDSVRETTLAIDSLKIEYRELWEAMVLFLMSNKLDSISKTLYEQSLTQPQALQPLGDFIKFLHTRYRSLNVQGVHNQDKSRNFRTSLAVATKPMKLECAICQDDHVVYQCIKFLNLNPSERIEAATKARLCINCLRRGHLANNCMSRSCFKCGKRHNTLLHINSNQLVSQQSSSSNVATTLTIQATNSKKKYAFLATALVEVADRDGNWVQCRALIDPGSQVHIVTERLRQKLKLDGYNINSGLAGLGETRVKINNQLNIQLRSRTSNFRTNIEAFVIKSISSLQPQQYVCTDEWNISNELSLADPKFYVPQLVDMLIGVELYAELIISKQIRLKEGLPVLQASELGWLIMGSADIRLAETRAGQLFCGIGTMELDQQIKLFWELEEYMPQKRMTNDELKCEGFFDATTIRDNGRFTVNIPFQASPSVLGDSKAIAYKRLVSIERKLSNNPELKKQYVEFMKEYEDQGHMQEVPSHDIRGPHYYLPHHCVLKPSSSTTKLRVVFDASAKTNNNISLNEIMLAGPRVQDDIFAIILRFRTKRYVFTADIRQMYRQINISPEDRNFQLILWRQDASQPIKTFQLRTVTYGTKAAPYLATKCLQRLAEDGEEKYPNAAKVMRDFYVDDIITGANEIEEAVQIQTQLRALLTEGGFQLRKWCANHPRLMENIAAEDMELQLDFNAKDDDYTKPLGLTWHPVVDMFQTTVNLKQREMVTKRTILSDTAQLFDPLGLVNPVIVTAKIFMQQLWKMKLDWDEEVPPELKSKWENYRNGLTALRELRIPRYMFALNFSGRVVLHAFADASEKAYGTAIYLRTVNDSGEIVVRLLCARSRVAPLKQTKLPLLELCAAKMTAEVVRTVIEQLAIALDEVYFWSDSEIVLSWIQRDAATLVTFVANRVSDIQTLSDVRKWRYVPSQDNPADLVSRGCTAQELCDSTKWFLGPEFLKHSQRGWPTQPHEKKSLAEYERTLKLVLTTTKPELSVLEAINHGNSYHKLQRIMAFILRAIRRFKCRKHHPVKLKFTNTNLTAEEMESACNKIFALVQRDEYAMERKNLEQRRQLPNDSKLSSLAPFIDDHGLIRVGGRLQQSALMYDEKHPILLPPKHFVTRLYMAFLHTSNLHAGPQAITAISRQRVWITQGWQLARSIVNSCVRCARIRPKCATQIMGQLPATRVTAARPFINCGVDFCGPIWIHYKIRGKRPQKSYIAVFCCFTTKAVHIEVVSDLSTNAFIGALKRFMARRGSCQNIYCDNATNFVGTHNQLSELQDVIFSNTAEEKIVNHCNQRRIQFHFIPPRTPHMGGLWEAAVKSFKHLLCRTIASASLTFEELCTVTAEIEAVLNSRPLTPMSSDPNDFNALTPGHFLIGEPVTATVDPHATDQKMSLLSRWQLVSFCRTEFWKRWSTEYITGLQQRAKWVKEYPDMIVGTLVLIRDDNLPPLQWTMGRIVDLAYGPDDHVRVVYVRTPTGTIRRAIHTVAPLPIDIQDARDTVTPETEEEEEHPKTPKKRKSQCATTLLTMMIALCLCLPLAAATTLRHVKVQSLKTNAGIFYDRQGQIYLSPTHWTIMAYVSLSGYQALDQGVVTLLDRMQTTVKTISRPEPYNDIIVHFNARLNHIRQRNQVLMHQQNRPRYRRSPLNIVGTIVNRLFGILDEEYAEEMKTTIGRIDINEHHLDQLLKNQTSILDSTINLIKKDRAEIINHTLQIQRSMKDGLAELSNALSVESRANRGAEYFNLLSSLVLSYLHEYEQIQDNIADITLGLHQGHTSMHIISPEQLQMQLETIRQQLPSSLMLPLFRRNDLHTIYKVMITQGRISGEYYLFKIQVPLLVSNHFNLYHLLSVPVIMNNTQMSIEPTTEYLAIDLQNNHYYALTAMELEKCVLITSKNHICHQTRPIEDGHARAHQCESEVMLAKTLPSSCSLTFSHPRDVWHQLAAPATWLFMIPTPAQMSVICHNGIIERATIQDAGVLSLDKGCTLRVKNITLTSYEEIVTTVE